MMDHVDGLVHAQRGRIASEPRAEISVALRCEILPQRGDAIRTESPLQKSVGEQVVRKGRIVDKWKDASAPAFYRNWSALLK